MRKPSLQVYSETEKGRVVRGQPGARSSDKVTMPAGDVLNWLAEAAANDRSWLRDFADDEITVSIDLYEVIQAYRHFRRSA